LNTLLKRPKVRMEPSPVEHLREEKARRVTSGGAPSGLLDCKAGAVCRRSPAAANLVSSPLTPLHPIGQADTPAFMDHEPSIASSPLVSADSTPVLVLSPPTNRLILSPASQAPANTPTCAKAATRLRDGKLEQGVLREAASRLQQRIQKHLLDSEDRKEQVVLDEENKRDLAEKKGDSVHNLDQRRDKTVSMDYQHEKEDKKDTVATKVDEQMRGMRTALVCPQEASDVEVVATAVDFVKFVKTTPGGEDLIHQFMGQKHGQDE